VHSIDLRALFVALVLIACGRAPARPEPVPLTFGDSLAVAAIEQTKHHVRYDPSYFSMPYPNGDVPDTLGVCTDVVIRAYRKLGIDLQKEAHEDIVRDKSAYGISRPDANIDHRRVPNLARFFRRKGTSLPVTEDTADYRAGDIVVWRLAPGLTHIGIVTTRHLIVHNIGAGPQLEDMLFAYEPIGHYRFSRATGR
jgi:uncharacterized protein